MTALTIATLAAFALTGHTPHPLVVPPPSAHLASPGYTYQPQEAITGAYLHGAGQVTKISGGACTPFPEKNGVTYISCHTPATPLITTTTPIAAAYWHHPDGSETTTTWDTK